MVFTDGAELRDRILANRFLPQSIRDHAQADGFEYCRVEDATRLIEIIRINDVHGPLIRFELETDDTDAHVDVPEQTARLIAGWILRHTNPGGRS